MSALALCGGLCFESTTNLTVEISGTSIFDDMPEFCKATNWLFSNGRQAEIPCKLLSGFQFALEPNLAMWGSLTSLTLNQPVMFKSLLQLLYCLPNITALAIHQLLIENTSAGNTLQNHYQEMQQIIAKPLDTKLETLLIKFSVDNVNQVTRVIQTLLIEIRTLRKLKLQPKYTNLACRFKDSAPYQYPHIIGVAIENCK
ncbi:hypothetical protein H4R24_002254 [Coemansia sp. RSA 988]|nr:hypothetical protein H4R24_002254 [Coemansia sp. RSA 988]